jgi:hypothetical protein
MPVGALDIWFRWGESGVLYNTSYGGYSGYSGYSGQHFTQLLFVISLISIKVTLAIVHSSDSTLPLNSLERYRHKSIAKV